MYDFTTHYDRSDLGSYKWEAAKKLNHHFDPTCIPLSVADMEFATAPEIVEGLKSYLDTVILGYAAPTKAYKEAVQNWMLSRHQFALELDEIVNTSGVVQALFNAVRSLTEEGDGVIIMPPVYYPFFRAVEASHRKVLRCPLIAGQERFEIDFDKFEQLAASGEAKALMFCSPHNPVSRVWTREELKRLEAIILKYDLLLLSDEIHADLCMPGHKHCVFASLSPELAQRSVTFLAATKSFNIAGLTLSSIIIKNAELREKFKAGLQAVALHSISGIAYEATRLAYTRAEPWLDAVIEIVYHNYKVFKRFIQERLPQLKLYPLEGSYLALLEERVLGLDKEALETMHIKAQLYLDEGYIFGEEGTGFSRFNLAVPTDVIEAALLRLELGIKELLSSKN
ncbi:MAG: PatB family C-S lyase [Bradymonadales bacterium]